VPGYDTGMSTAMVSRPVGAQLWAVSGLGVSPCAFIGLSQLSATITLRLRVRLGGRTPGTNLCTPGHRSPSYRRFTGSYS
jgi:hypothetical protein